MGKLIAFLAFLCVLVSCSDNDPCDGFVPDVLTQFLFIELVDTNGNNLIENGTYSLNEIFTERNSDRFPAIIYTEEVDFIPANLHYNIEIGVVGNNGSNNLWSIDLSDDETDTLRMDLSIASQDCNGTFYQINEIVYNNQTLPVQDLGENRFQIQVVK